MKPELVPFCELRGHRFILTDVTVKEDIGDQIERLSGAAVVCSVCGFEIPYEVLFNNWDNLPNSGDNPDSPDV